MTVSMAPVAWTLGLDLGVWHLVTASSTVADPTSVSVDVNSLSNRSTPTCAAFDCGAQLRLVGEQCEGKLASLINSGSSPVMENVTAYLGLNPGEAPLVELGPVRFTVSCNFGGTDLVNVDACLLTSVLIEKLLDCARLGRSGAEPLPRHATVAVPDWFTEVQVQAAVKACRIAGLQHVSVVSSSLAVATALLHKEGAAISGSAGDGDQVVNVLVVDVGYSHTTSTLIEFQGARGTTVKNVVTDPSVGVVSLIKVLEKMTGTDSCSLGTRAAQRLKNACQKTLKELSMLSDANIDVECFTPEGSDLHLHVTREKLASGAKSKLSRITDCVRSCIEEGVQVHRVEIIGGGSRVPCVQDAILQALPMPVPLGRGLDGSSSVAVGAALHAAGLREVQCPSPLITPDVSVEEHLALIAESARQVEKAELSRLDKRNCIEGLMYKVRGWVSEHGSLIDGPTVSAHIRELEMWLEEDRLLEEYTQKLGELESYIGTNCSRVMEKLQQDCSDQDRRLTEGAAVASATAVKEDHDTRKLPTKERLRYNKSRHFTPYPFQHGV